VTVKNLLNVEDIATSDDVSMPNSLYLGPIWGSFSQLQLFPKVASARSCPKQSTASENSEK
jgi:hypothetical protein